jgi:hypothetical protein
MKSSKSQVLECRQCHVEVLPLKVVEYEILIFAACKDTLSKENLKIFLAIHNECKVWTIVVIYKF